MKYLKTLALSLAVGGSSMVTAQAATEMRCSHQLPPGHHIAKVIDQWAAEVESQSDGEIDVQIFGADSLVGARENIVSTAKGDIDVWRKWPDSDAAAFLGEKLEEKGLKNVVWLFTTNSSVFTSNGKFLKAPEDFEGVKIRGLEPSFNASLEAMGAAPSSMSGSKVYQALATGVIDAAITDVAAAVSRKYYEVQDHFVVLPVISVYFHGYVNPTWYDGLSDKAKAALDGAGKKAAGWAIEASLAASASAPDQLKEKGANVHIATDAENAALQDAMRPAFNAKFAGDPDSQKLIELIDQM